ncbi:MAG: CoA-binding protein [Deltaproteobacteria bacterium]|nr:CoA-binding protein [Candidatus Zymogenaceae bacterium]
MTNLDFLFYPRTIAVIGASPDVVRDRGGFFNCFHEHFKGKLFAVNPKYTDVKGVPCYPRITEVPEPVDYAVIVLPRDKVPQAIEDCVAAKTKFVLVFSSGFSEAGEKELEQRLIDTLKKGETRMIGPNCIGINAPEKGVLLYPSLATDRPGEIAFFSQSGGHALNFLVRGVSSGLEFNKVVSVGNQADLKIEDFLEYFAEDDKVKYICGYVEDIKQGERFKKLARHIVLEKKKPLVIWKGGRSEEGARATLSHTGAIAVPTRIWDSVMDQLGVINAETQIEMLDVLICLKYGFKPRGLNALISVAGGGSSVELTDAVSTNGLSVPTLAPGIQEIIGATISRVNTSTANPVDLGMFGFDPKIFVAAAVEGEKDPNIDLLVLCQYPEMVRAMSKDFWDYIEATMSDGLKELKKPAVMVIPRLLLNNPELEAIRTQFTGKLAAVNIPAFPNAERPARAAYQINKYLNFMKNHGITI